MLLITVVIIGLLFWQTDIFRAITGGTASSTNSLNLPTQLEQGKNAIQAAKNAKQLIENGYGNQPNQGGY
jgi:hypothetical protein